MNCWSDLMNYNQAVARPASEAKDTAKVEQKVYEHRASKQN
jgi:hypothetical protein